MRRSHIIIRGITLVEGTFIIAIIALVLGAVWTAAAKMHEEIRVNNAMRDFMAVSNAIAAMGPNAIGATDAADETSSRSLAGILIDAGAFPADMVDTGFHAVINPWETQARIYPHAVVIRTGTYMPGLGYTLSPGDKVPGAPVNAFEILFNGVPTEACKTLGSWLGGVARDQRMVSLLINSRNNTITNFPASPSLVAQHCNPADNDMDGAAQGHAGFFGGTNSIDVVYMFN